MISASLSNIELYFTPEDIIDNQLIIRGEEFNHAVKVMRHSEGGIIYITTGEGKIYKSEINNITRQELIANVLELYSFENRMKNVYFCLPKLKSQERFEFALEKCIELGITNFIVFESERCIAKGERLERWQKIIISAMKQSLRSYMPKLETVKSLNQIISMEGSKILFEQNSEKSFRDFKIDTDRKYFFLFGPEGGFSDEEIQLVKEGERYKLGNNRLRSETAVTTVAALLTA